MERALAVKDLRVMAYIKRSEHPGIIYVSKESGKIYQLKEDGSELDSDKPLDGINLLLYKYVNENNLFKIYHFK